MEDYRNKVSNYMQLYPRILVNVLVISVNILVNLLKLATAADNLKLGASIDLPPA